MAPESNILKDKIINDIIEVMEQKQNKCSVKILYFESPISNVISLDGLPITDYYKRTNWSSLKVKILLKIKSELISNNFFYYKDRNKLRLKKNV